MEPGTPIRCEMTKWGDRPHWQFPGLHLGADEHGEWLGFPAGTHNQRPGHQFHSAVDAVTLVQPGRWHLPTFQAPGIWCDLYIDVATPGRWDGTVLRMVDLDLDVIRMSDPLPASLHAQALEAGRAAGEGFVDDEDEFAQHRVQYGYPDDIARLAMATCDRVEADVTTARAPYDGTHQRWLAELTRLTSA